MAKRVRVSNPLVNRILFIVSSIIVIVVLIFVSMKIVLSDNSLIYEVETDDYTYRVLTSYEDYTNLVNEYGITNDLTLSDFYSSYYIASFQEYDSCSESKYKKIENVNYENGVITVTFRVYNKCGYCHNKALLYLIKIDKYNLITNVKYEYNYDKELNCGSI